MLGIGGWNPALPGAEDYVQAADRVTGHAPDGWASPVTYASLQVLEQAIEKAGTLDRKKVLDTLLLTRDPGRRSWVRSIEGPRQGSAVGRRTMAEWSIRRRGAQQSGGRQAGHLPQADMVMVASSSAWRDAGRSTRCAGSLRHGAWRLIERHFANAVEHINVVHRSRTSAALFLGGLYALVAIGFNFQYGVARILDLAYGEFLMAGAFAAFWMFTLAGNQSTCEHVCSRFR